MTSIEIIKELNSLTEREIKDLNYSPKYISTQLELGEALQVNSFGGEGEGDNIGSTIFFKDHNVYITMNGYYDSYNGADFSDVNFTEVFPSISVTKVYSSIKPTIEFINTQLEEFKTIENSLNF